MVDTLDLLLIPFVTGLLVLAGHVPLGREVLRRGIIFIDLCIAQVAALGLVLAESLHVPEGWSIAFAAAAAVTTGLFLSWTEPRFQQVQEAIIGSLYVFSAAVLLLLLAHDPHGAEAMDQLLAGQLLWVQFNDLYLLIAATGIVVVLALLGWLGRRQVFYLVFPLVVTASVSLIGVFLVFASLVLPALAVLNLKGKAGLLGAYGVGVVGYAVGLFGSLAFDLPAGPAVICSLVIGALLTMLLQAAKR